MNYVWEVLLAAENEKTKRNEIRFLPAKAPSPYVEVSFAELNTTSLENAQVEVNPLYRFSDIFSELFSPDITEYQTLRGIFLDTVMHYIAETDLLSGMHRQEFFFWFLMEDIRKGSFGEKSADAFALFETGEQRMIVTYLLGLYRSARYKELFKGLIKGLYENAIIYEGRDRAEAIYLYIGRKDTEKERKKIHFLVDTFLPLSENVEIFYDKHFGIMDVEETMVTDMLLLI